MHTDDDGDFMIDVKRAYQRSFLRLMGAILLWHVKSEEARTDLTKKDKLKLARSRKHVLRGLENLNG